MRVEHLLFSPKKRLFLIATLVLLLNTLNIVFGEEMSIELLPKSGPAIDIGVLVIQENSDKDRVFQVRLNDDLFSKQFLSMRPFRCLQGPTYMLCHLDYPYKNKRILSKADLRDLEYDLLFIRKDSKEFGIDAWNGLYYKLEWHQNIIKGVLHEVDLNILAVPPAADVTYPISETDLNPIDEESHWLPHIIIR